MRGRVGVFVGVFDGVFGWVFVGVFDGVSGGVRGRGNGLPFGDVVFGVVEIVARWRGSGKGLA